MTKELQKQMREVAELLPVFNYTTKETYPITGKELLLTGVEDVEGKEIDEDGVYTLEAPVFHRFNHYRRMKRIYERNVKSLGHERAYKLVQDYITACVKAAQIKEVESE